MNFQYTEEQKLLADSVSRLLEQHYDFEARKRFIASDEGYSPEVWQQMAELGLLAICLPAEHGGFDGGALDLVATMEAIGSALTLEPYVSTLALGARLLARCGSAAQQAALLPGVAEGRVRLAFAHAEPDSRHELAQIRTSAQAVPGGWVLSGAKSIVMHATMADRLLVSARTSGAPGDESGISLFLVDPSATGVHMKTMRTQDNHRAADIRFESVHLPDEALIGEPGSAFDAILEAFDFATALSCVEAVGAMKSANLATLEYLKTRRQFGVPIGSFQALQHRLVDMFVSAEQARSLALLACSKVDASARGEIGPAERMHVVSAAKVKVAQASRHVGQEAIQLHGGMGMTQEMKVAHTFKRLTMIAQSFGDADYHLDRFAQTGA